MSNVTVFFNESSVKIAEIQKELYFSNYHENLLIFDDSDFFEIHFYFISIYDEV